MSISCQRAALFAVLGALAFAGTPGFANKRSNLIRARSAIQSRPHPLLANSIVTLGNTGRTTTFLGLGTGSWGFCHTSRQKRLGEEAFIRLVRHALERGLRFFDTADSYGTHELLCKALRGVDRRQLFIQTKTGARTATQLENDIDRFRNELGTPKLDSLLVHHCNGPDWPVTRRPVIEALIKAKRLGQVDQIGVSCHGGPAFDAATRADWVDIQLARINPFPGIHIDGPNHVIHERCRAMVNQGRAITGMKVLSAGEHVAGNEPLTALKFVIEGNPVHNIVIGFESPHEIDQACNLIPMAQR